MQQNDDVVSSWLEGADSADGFDNPAGPLYIDGAAETEAAMTNPQNADVAALSPTFATCAFGPCVCP